MKADGRLDGIVHKWTVEEDDSLAPQTWPGENGTLRCQIDPSVEPMCYIAEDGSYRGLDIDIILAIAEELDYRIEFTENGFNDLIPALLTNQADFIASGITITAERQKTVDFCEGYLDAGTVIVVLDSSATFTLSFMLRYVRSSLNRIFLEDDRWFSLLNGLFTTLWMAAVTAVLGLILGIALYLWKYAGSSFAASLIEKPERLSALMPLSTWLLICYYLIFPRQTGQGFAAAIFALSIKYAIESYGSISGNMDSIPKGQIDAASCIDYNRWECLRYIMLPRALVGMIGSFEKQTIEHVHNTSLVSFAAVMDIQAVADGIGAQTAQPFLPIILTTLIYILLNLAVSALFRRTRKKVAARLASADKWISLEKEVSSHDPS